MRHQISNERLSGLISRFGAAAMEARQVSKRINTLLQSRFMELKREHCRQHSAMKAERIALADDRFEAFINETAEISYQATLSRIQYETHAMLYRARQSLRGLNQPQQKREFQAPSER